MITMHIVEQQILKRFKTNEQKIHYKKHTLMHKKIIFLFTF